MLLIIISSNVVVCARSTVVYAINELGIENIIIIIIIISNSCLFATKFSKNKMLTEYSKQNKNKKKNDWKRGSGHVAWNHCCGFLVLWPKIRCVCVVRVAYICRMGIKPWVAKEPCGCGLNNHNSCINIWILRSVVSSTTFHKSGIFFDLHRSAP